MDSRHTFLPVVSHSVNRNIAETPLWNKYLEDKPWEKKEDQTKTGKKKKVMHDGKVKVVN